LFSPSPPLSKGGSPVTDTSSTGQPKLDVSTPHGARVWNYWLGGTNHFEPDRALGDQIKEFFPDIVDIARESRRFLARAVGFLAGEAGIPPVPGHRDGAADR
jgi:hypothetical protein